MQMKLALATWNGRISPVFDVARHVLMLDVEGSRVLTRYEETLPGAGHEAQAERLMTLEPDVLICGAISKPMAALLAAKKIRVISFTAGDVEQVLGAWFLGTLPNPTMSMPGCCRGPKHLRHGQAGCGRQASRARCRQIEQFSRKEAK